VAYYLWIHKYLFKNPRCFELAQKCFINVIHSCCSSLRQVQWSGCISCIPHAVLFLDDSRRYLLRRRLWIFEFTKGWDNVDADPKQTTQTRIFCHPCVFKNSCSSSNFIFVTLFLSRGCHYLILQFRFSDSNGAPITQISPLRVHFNEHTHPLSTLCPLFVHSFALRTSIRSSVFIHMVKYIIYKPN